MKRLYRTFYLVAIVVICYRLYACERCSDADSIAELIELQGQVERDWADRVNRWQPAERDTRFRVGDGVRTRESSRAILELSEGSYVRIKSQTMIRFSRSTSGVSLPRIDVQMGEAELVAGHRSVSFITSIGVAIVNPGGLLQIRKTPQGVDYLVKIGMTTFQDKQGHVTEARANEGVRIGIGDAVFERLDLKTSSVPGSNQARADAGSIEINPPPNTDAQRPGKQFSIGAHEGLDLIDNGPRLADFSAPAGESFTVHASRPPVVVELRFDEICPDGAVVRRGERKSEKSRGDRSANLTFPKGVSRYRVHCLDGGGIQKKPKASGTVVVMRDAGTARLPRSAPSSVVDADGRYYKVLYQNLLPAITIRWPQPPKSARSYVLTIVSQTGKTRDLTIDKPEHTFEAGALGEGIYNVQFRTPDDSASRMTRVEIRFDNAAPKASVREPREGEFKPGDEVSISGVAVPGWKVSLQGGNMSMDTDSRFSGKLVYTDKYRAVALRLGHAKNGIHYYLRRSISGIR